ncbi:MAG: hypothetical protein LBP61_01115, partial [Desulfovibrio sp.]|nr:hypothetical protein [Desulfovibrio sp.]
MVILGCYRENPSGGAGAFVPNSGEGEFFHLFHFLGGDICLHGPHQFRRFRAKQRRVPRRGVFTGRQALFASQLFGLQTQRKHLAAGI